MPWVTLASQLTSKIDKDPISCYLTTYCVWIDRQVVPYLR
jgi:hypothetical protein